MNYKGLHLKSKSINMWKYKEWSIKVHLTIKEHFFQQRFSLFENISNAYLIEKGKENANYYLLSWILSMKSKIIKSGLILPAIQALF